MAYDKAVDSTALETGLTTIADAIRTKGGTPDPLEFPQGMAQAIASIPTGGAGCVDYLEQAMNGRLTAYTAPSTVHRIKDYIFSGCSELTAVVAPTVTTIGSWSFSGCSKLTAVVAPKAREIVGTGAFSGCSVLEKLLFPDAYLYDGLVFENCKNLRVIETGNSKNRPPFATFRGNSTFIGCEKLTALIIRWPVMMSLSGRNQLERSSLSAGTGYVYVPKELVEQYKVATNWVTIADQIRAIEDYPEITGG